MESTATIACALPRLAERSRTSTAAKSPNARAKSAVAALRAGFTDVLVTGILIKWISVRSRCGLSVAGRGADDMIGEPENAPIDVI